MCPSSSFRCGSCLSKWNGKSWESSFKCVLTLKSWSLMLNKKYQLCVEGLCDIDSNLAVCIPITDRLNSFWVSNDCTLLKLRGILNTKDLPDYVAKKFDLGIPPNWKEIVNKWIEFVQRGDESSFSWEDDESFNSCYTSFLLTRSRRVVSGRNPDGKSKEKSIQRIPAGLSRVIEQERDSAVPTSEDCSTKAHQPGSPPSIWHSPSPQLPAHKVQEIFQWIDIAPHSNEPLERDVEDDCRDSSAESVAPSSVVLNPMNRVPNSETVPQKSNNVVPQSTPRNQASTEGLPQWNISSVHNTSSFDYSFKLDSISSDFFSKSNSRNHSNKNSPKKVSKIPPSHLLSIRDNTQVSGSGSDTSSNLPLSKLVGENVFRKPNRIRHPKLALKTLPGKVPQHNSKNADLPGSRMGRRLSSTIRPRRKRTLQKIERWRPVLGVDGCLKVQGYLLLQCDMTAGQILTTNTVVEWGERRVVSRDGREYELVGDPYGKIPDDLRNQLLGPLDCEYITAKLMKFQGLKDRTDWTAEYELFYGNGNDNGDSEMLNTRNSRTTHNMRNNRRTTPQNSSLSRQKLKSAALTVNSQKATTCVMGSPTTGKLRSTNRKKIGSGSKPTAEQNSDSSSRTQKSTCNTSGLNQSVNNTSSSKVNRNSLNLTNSRVTQKERRVSVTANNDLTVSPNNLQDKENNHSGKSSAGATRSCFENITWKSTQNQMMLPSPRLSADSSNVDFSSSRIKVSYITPDTKSSPKNIQNSSEFHSENPAVNESLSPNQCTPKSRPSRSPTKRACLPCLQDSKPRTAPHSPHSPLSHARRQTIPKQTEQVISPSPARNQTKASPARPQTGSRKKSPLQVTKTTVQKHVTRQSLQSSKSNSATTSSDHMRTPKSPPTRPSSPKNLRSSTRTTARQLRVLVRRLDSKNSSQNVKKPSPERKSTSSRPRRKCVTKESKQATPKSSKKNEKKENVSAARKTSNKKPVEVKKNKKDEEEEKKKNKGKKTSAKKIIYSSSEEISDEDGDDTSSKCSTVSSVGPSASVIFEMNNCPVARRKPRTLKERRERDAQIAEMGKKLATKKTTGIDADDDPMANLIASHKFSPLPQEWCRHENLLGKGRKRRRPSSSDGTVSPSRSGLEDGFGNEDATSSVATPQLLMRPPDPKQVQSYLQRQRAWNAKPQRPTRQSKRGNNKLLLPHIDYAAVFHPDTSDSEESTSEVASANSDWDA